MLLANLIVLAEFSHSRCENTNTTSVAIGSATINPASSGRLPDSQEPNEITTAAINTFTKAKLMGVSLMGLLKTAMLLSLSSAHYLPVKFAAM